MKYAEAAAARAAELFSISIAHFRFQFLLELLGRIFGELAHVLLKHLGMGLDLVA